MKRFLLTLMMLDSLLGLGTGLMGIHGLPAVVAVAVFHLLAAVLLYRLLFGKR